MGTSWKTLGFIKGIPLSLVSHVKKVTVISILLKAANVSHSSYSS